MENFTCSDPSIENYRYFGAALGVLVTVVGTLGNCMTMLAFGIEKKLQTKLNALIVNLSLSDLLYCAFLQPITVDSYIHLRWRMGADGCRVFGLLLFMSNAVSILNLGSISVNRYFLIRDKRLFDRIYTRYTMPAFLGTPWLMGLASFAPLWTSFDFLKQVCTCSFHRERGRPYTTVLLVFYFVAGIASITVFYCLIHRRVAVSSKALHKYRVRMSGHGPPGAQGRETAVVAAPREASTSCSLDAANSATDTTAGTWTEALRNEPNASRSHDEASANSSDLDAGENVTKKRRDMKKKNKEKSAASAVKKNLDGEFKKVTKMCYVIFLVFVVCYLPFCVLNVIDRKGTYPPIWHMMAANCTWLNSGINPILYALMNRQFKDAYKAIVLSPLRLMRKTRH
ncbi:unnamed protein product [Lampetra fluviatilis]